MQWTPKGSPRWATLATRCSRQSARRSAAVGGGDLAAAIEQRARLAKDPRVLDGAAADHHALAAGLAQRALGVRRAAHVAVDDDRDAHDLARARRPRPVRRARVPHRPPCGSGCVIAATPASSRRRARSTMGMCDSGPRPMRVLTVTGSDTLAADQPRHRHHRRGIAQPAGAGAAPGDLGDPAAAVDVDEERLGLLGEARGLGQALGVRPVDLDGGELVVVGELDLAPGVAAAAQEALDVHELGHRERGAVLAAEAPEHGVGHVLHGGEDDGLLRVERAQAFARRGHSREALARGLPGRQLLMPSAELRACPSARDGAPARPSRRARAPRCGRTCAR